MYRISSVGLVAVMLLLALLVILPAEAAALQSFTVTVSYSPGNCVRNNNGYGGSGSYPYTVPADGMYYVDDLVEVVPPGIYSDWWAIVDPLTYDPNVLFTTQALAYGVATDPPVPGPLSAGQDVLVMLIDNGGYGTVVACEADGFTYDVAGTIHDTTGLGGGAADELIAGPDLVPLPSGAAVGTFTADTPLYYAPDPIAALPTVMTAGKTLWVTGQDASGRYYQVVLSGHFLWVPVGTIGPNYDAVWNGTPLPTTVVQ